MITEPERRFLERLHKMYGEWQAEKMFAKRTGKKPPKLEEEDQGFMDLNSL